MNNIRKTWAYNPKQLHNRTPLWPLCIPRPQILRPKLHPLPNHQWISWIPTLRHPHLRRCRKLWLGGWWLLVVIGWCEDCRPGKFQSNDAPRYRENSTAAHSYMIFTSRFLRLASLIDIPLQCHPVWTKWIFYHHHNSTVRLCRRTGQSVVIALS